jgi:cytochrome b561
MTRKCIISAVVMFVMAWGLSFVVHGLLLGGDYAGTQGMRPPADAQTRIHWLILAQAIFGVAFAWVYVQGKEDKPWLAQGVRYGIAIAALTVIPTYLIYHVVTPVPLALALKQIGYDTIRVVLMGVVLAGLNR